MGQFGANYGSNHDVLVVEAPQVVQAGGGRRVRPSQREQIYQDTLTMRLFIPAKTEVNRRLTIPTLLGRPVLQKLRLYPAIEKSLRIAIPLMHEEKPMRFVISTILQTAWKIVIQTIDSRRVKREKLIELFSGIKKYDNLVEALKRMG